MTYRAFSVRLIDGMPALVATGRTELDELRLALERLNSGRVWRGGDPVPGSSDFIRGARAVVALIDAGAPVPEAEPSIAPQGRFEESWITTDKAAKVFGITPRAIRKRVATGSLTGRKVGGLLLINTREISPDAA